MSRLGPAHRGYQYQDLLTAYHFVLCLQKDFNSITVDRKFNDFHRFDDLTFQLNGHTFRRQIKSSENENRRLEERHFTKPLRGLLRLGYLLDFNETVEFDEKTNAIFVNVKPIPNKGQPIESKDLKAIFPLDENWHFEEKIFYIPVDQPK